MTFVKRIFFSWICHRAKLGQKHIYAKGHLSKDWVKGQLLWFQSWLKVYLLGKALAWVSTWYLIQRLQDSFTMEHLNEAPNTNSHTQGKHKIFISRSRLLTTLSTCLARGAVVVVYWIERLTLVRAIRVRPHLVRKRKINEKRPGLAQNLKKVFALHCVPA